MDVAAVVVAIRVGADQGLMAGEMFTAIPLPQLLSLIHHQAVVGAVLWVKADDVVVALYALPLLVLPIAEVGPHTGHGEILAAAVEGGNR